MHLECGRVVDLVLPRLQLQRLENDRLSVRQEGRDEN